MVSPDLSVIIPLRDRTGVRLVNCLRSLRWQDLFLSGGLYVGGTDAANYLDDYEEGTWTPALEFGGGTTGITYGEQTGHYTKIGRMVFVQADITLTSKGTDTGAAKMTGLPFTSSSTLNSVGSNIVCSYSNMASLQAAWWAKVDKNSTVVSLLEGQATGLGNIDNANFTDTSVVRITLAYEVA